MSEIKVTSKEEALEKFNSKLGFNDDSLHVKYYPTGDPYKSHVSYSMEQLPGCCGVVVLYHASVWPQWKGLGTKIHEDQLEIADELNYSLTLCTVLESNGMAAQRHILEKNNWKKIYSFNNKRTGNRIGLWVKDI